MYCIHCKTDTHNTERCWKLKKIAREKGLSEKKHHIPNGLSVRKSTLLRAGRERTAISNLTRKLSSASRASTEKKKRNTRKWPVQKSLSLVTQTPLMSPLMLWNRVKGCLARKDMRSVLSDLPPGVIKLTSKILIQMMIAKCLQKSAVKNLKRSLIPSGSPAAITDIIVGFTLLGLREEILIFGASSVA
jgi:hypothetical protein